MWWKILFIEWLWYLSPVTNVYFHTVCIHFGVRVSFCVDVIKIIYHVALPKPTEIFILHIYILYQRLVTAYQSFWPFTLTYFQKKTLVIFKHNRIRWFCIIRAFHSWIFELDIDVYVLIVSFKSRQSKSQLCEIPSNFLRTFFLLKYCVQINPIRMFCRNFLHTSMVKRVYLIWLNYI